MSKSLLIVEKPYSEKAISEALAEQLDLQNTDVVYIYPTSWWQWKIPKKAPLRKIPATTSPKEMSMRVNPAIEKIPLGKLRYDGQSKIVSIASGWSLTEFKAAILDRWNDYDQVICAPHADRNGWGSMVRWLQWLLSDNPEILIGKRVPCLVLPDMEAETIRKSFNKPISISSKVINKLSQQFEDKHLFDAWWNMNSGAVFGIAQRKAGISAPVMVTKYELMLLQILSRNKGEPFFRSDVLSGLAHWIGTGNCKSEINEPSESIRFAKIAFESKDRSINPDAFMFVGIGSSMSRGSLIANLERRGWIEFDQDERIYISELGEKFLYRCHKHTFDPDLPFRLEEWIHWNDISAMKRYIRRYFNRQKNHIM